MAAARGKGRRGYDVAIVGGGMVGAAAACALGGSLLKVVVIERRKPLEESSKDAGFDTRVSAITLAGRELLRRLGAWESMPADRVAAVREMRVWEAGGPGAIRFDGAEIAEPALAYIVENRELVAALWRRLREFANVHTVFPAEIESIEWSEGAAALALASGERIDCRLVIGADGADSKVRAAAGIELRRHAFGQAAIVANVETEEAHGECAYQCFLPTGPLAFLPLPKPHLSSIVWSADTPLAEELSALDDAGFSARLREAIERRLGAMRAIGPRQSFPLAMQQAYSYIEEGVALIGDAAHTIHPLAGQGVNLGFLDAAALAEVLIAAAEAGRDIGARETLRPYERWRKSENLAMAAVTSGFQLLFGNDFAVLRQLRGIGLAAADAAGPIKRMIMRHASGIEGDLPALARRSPG